MREALAALSARGLVEIKRGAKGGAFVLAPDPKRMARDMAHLLVATSEKGARRTLIDARVWVQRAVLMEATPHVAAGVLDGMTGAIAAQRSETGAAFVAADRDFHRFLASAAQNRTMGLISDAVVIATQDAVGMQNFTALNRHRVAATNDRIRAGVAAGDTDAAIRAVEDLAAFLAQKQSEARGDKETA